MLVQDRILTLAAKVLRVISFKNVVLWALTALVGIIGYALFESRSIVTDYIINGRETVAPTTASFEVSDTSRKRIRQIVDASEIVNSIIVLNADIRNNRRIPLFWYSDDNSLQKEFDRLFIGRYGGIPLFTSDEKNNENVVGVINGEFACNTFKDSGSNTTFPGLETRLPYSCRTSLPPYYGQFSGYITVTLNRTPSSDELSLLKSETLNISTEIYFRDVLPASRKVVKSTAATSRATIIALVSK